MTLWRLELLRHLRTRKWVALTAVYGFFAITGPLTARYIRQLLEAIGGLGDAAELIPQGVPVDGITQFTANVSQLGLLTVVIVSAGTLAFDTRPEWAVFLRTRVADPAQLLLPRYVAATLFAVTVHLLGTAVAYALTRILLGPLDIGPLVIGTLLGVAYLAWAILLTAVASSISERVLSIVLWTLGTLIALPALGLVSWLEPWLPSELLGAVDETIRGRPSGDFLRSLAVAGVTGAGAWWWATRRLRTREL